MKKTPLIVFSHIEKCGGTSIVTMVRNYLPLYSCEAVSAGNRISDGELNTICRLYGNLMFLSGHNVYPSDKTRLEQAFQRPVYLFTILRDPLERLVSNYLHDLRHGKWEGSLRDYAEIPWKQDYMLRFLGNGNPSKAADYLKNVDAITSIAGSEVFVSDLLLRVGLVRTALYQRDNQATGELPPDVLDPQGIPVGRYRVSCDDFDFMAAANKGDRDLLKTVGFTSHAMLDRQFARLSDRYLPLKKKLATMKRNLLFKPAIGVPPGTYALPRNSVSARNVEAADAFR